jgi:mono/diheme cytochrome c family protein
MSDADMAAVLGYLRGLEPVHNEVPPFQANAVAKIMNALGAFGPSSIGEPITSAQSAPQPGTVEYGAYLVSLAACRDCHQQNLAGGQLPFSDPNEPHAANLTPAGNLTNWSEADFMAAVRTGTLPSGSQLTEGMPRYRISDEDLADIFKYLQSLPPLETE